MIHNYKDLQDEINRHTHSVDQDTVTRNKLWINVGYMRIMYDMEYPHLRREATYDTVAGQRNYIPVTAPMKILNVRIPSQNFYLTKLNVEKQDEWRPYYNTDPHTGTPRIWYLDKWQGVLAQPTTVGGSVVTVVSTNSADTTQTVTVEGIVSYSGVSSNEVDREVVTLNGTNAVATSRTFVEVLSIAKSGITVGTVTATADTGATTLLSIGPFARTKRYQNMGLEPVPNQDYLVYYKYIPWFAELVNDSDVPLMPEGDIPLIIDAAMLYAAEWAGDNDVLQAREQRYAEKLGKARERMMDDEDTVTNFLFSTGPLRRGVYQPGDFNAYLRDLYWVPKIW